MPQRLSPKEVSRKIKQLKLVDPQITTDAEFLALIGELCVGFKSPTSLVEIPWAHRARRHKSGVRFEHSSELWCPPARLVSKYSRANRPGEPRLYVCSHQNTAVLELRPEVDEELTIVQLLPRRPAAEVKVHVMQIGIPELVAPHDPKVGHKQVEDTPRGKEMLGDQQALDSNQLIRKFFVEEFTKLMDHRKHEDYRLCAAIAEFHTSSPRIDGFWYPSIATGATNSNLALKPESAHRLLQPHKCWTVRIERRVDVHSYEAQCVGTADIGHDGRIIWK